MDADYFRLTAWIMEARFPTVMLPWAVSMTSSQFKHLSFEHPQQEVLQGPVACTETRVINSSITARRARVKFRESILK